MKATKKEPREYAPTEDGRLSNDQAQRVGAVLDEITDCGILPIPEADLPEWIVAAAKKKSSPIHDLFEWDDAKAAHRGRLDRANYLVRHVTITVTVTGGGTRTVLPLIRVVSSEGTRIVVDTIKGMEVPEYRKQVLARVVAELVSVRRRHADLKELASVFDAIDAAQQRLEV